MMLQGGLDMTLDQDYNVAIWSAFIHGHEGGGGGLRVHVPHRAKPKLIYAMSVLPLGSYLASNNAAQYLAKEPAEQSLPSCFKLRKHRLLATKRECHTRRD